MRNMFKKKTWKIFEILLDFFVRHIKRQPTYKLFIIGFISIILIGSILLKLPIANMETHNISYIDALFTSTSAVCVTGLTITETSNFTFFGKVIIALLIQAGGLGIALISVSSFMFSGLKIGLKSKLLIKESIAKDHTKEILSTIKAIIKITVISISLGSIVSYFIFTKDYSSVKAIGLAIFHSVSSFNNAGFDLFGKEGLSQYQNNILFNMVTSTLIFFGGIGYLVIIDLIRNKSARKLTLHSKVVLTTSLILIIVGTLLLKFSESITLINAYFLSVSARTAGFSTVPISSISEIGQIIILILMFIGASPGSTGGGVKTSTIFIMFIASKSLLTGNSTTVFKRRLPTEVILKAYYVFFLSFIIVLLGTLILRVLEPNIDFIQIYFEIISAFGTVGLSTGITSSLSEISKILLIILMFIGRVGVLTISSAWISPKQPRAEFTEENISI